MSEESSPTSRRRQLASVLAPLLLGTAAFFFGRLLTTIALVGFLMRALLLDWGHGRELPLLAYLLPLALTVILACVIGLGFRYLPSATKVLVLRALADRHDEIHKAPYQTGLATMSVLAVFGVVNAFVLAPVAGFIEVLYLYFPKLYPLFPNINFAWLALSVFLAYRLEANGASHIGLLWAVALCASAVYKSTSHLTTRRGALKLLKKEVERLYPGHVLTYALILATSFGAIYLHISRTDANAFSEVLTWQTALYFSIVTFATIGYGDIHPASNEARFVCMAEIVLGLTMLIVAVNASMTTWLKNDQSDGNSEDEKRFQNVIGPIREAYLKRAQVAHDKGIPISEVPEDLSSPRETEA